MSEYDAFAAVYDEWTGPIGEDDVDFYVSLAAEAVGPGVELDLRLGDMRELALEERTDLVICPFRSLLHVHGHDERLRVFRGVFDTLSPGGRFAWNAFVFDPEI